MSPTAYSFADEFHTLVTDAILDANGVLANNYDSVCAALNGTASISTVTLATGTFMVTFKDARTFTIFLNPGPPPSFKVVSGSFFVQAEFDALRALASAVRDMIRQAGMTTLTDTFA